MGNCCIDAKLTIARQITQLIPEDKLVMMRTQLSITHITEPSLTCDYEVGAFYWTVLAPDIVNLGREEQGSVSV